MRLLSLLITTLALQGCVIHYWPPIPTTQHTDIPVDIELTMSPTFTAPPIVTPLGKEESKVPITETVIVSESCERFQWTKQPIAPPQATFVKDMLANREEYTPGEINDILLDYVFSLRRFLSDGYQSLRQEYVSYLTRCGYEPDGSLPERLYP